MSILSRIVHAIADKIYPEVEAVLDKAVVVAEHVAAVADTVANAADRVAEHAEDLRDRVEAAAPRYGASLEQILDAVAVKHKKETGEDLTGWRQSIVDVIKLANLYLPEDEQIDPSPTNRKKLAGEFGMVNYKGTEKDNATLSKHFLDWLRSQ